MGMEPMTPKWDVFIVYVILPNFFMVFKIYGVKNGVVRFMYTQVLAYAVYLPLFIVYVIFMKLRIEFPIPSRVFGSHKSMGSPNKRTQTEAARKVSFSGL